MTIRDEFREILRVLLETPQPPDRETPSAEKKDTTEPVPDKLASGKQCADRKCKGAA